MKPRVIFITGSDTGAGKTVVAALLTRYLRERGMRVVGLKPICSGGRADARMLHVAAGKVLALDEVNPWHFRAALAPVIAARKEKRRVTLREVVSQIRRTANDFEVTVVEGAGGLLSPLGEDFDSRDLIRELKARPVVVSANRLGAVNQALLVLEALPVGVRKKTPVVLSAVEADGSRAVNVSLLRERMGERVWELSRCNVAGAMTGAVKKMLEGLCRQIV